jgi:hypothetical protein
MYIFYTFFVFRYVVQKLKWEGYMEKINKET